MARLRLRVGDLLGAEKAVGCVSSVARLEFQVGPWGQPSVLRLLDEAGTLRSSACLCPGSEVQFEHGPWESGDWATQAVDRLTIAISTPGARTEQIRLEVVDVEEVEIHLPVTSADPWEIAVLGGGDHTRHYTTQSRFSISAPWVALG